MIGSENISFEFSGANLLFFFLPLFLIVFWRLFRYREKQNRLFTDSRFFAFLSVPRSKEFTFAKFAGVMFIWLFAVFALMDPIGNIRYASPDSGTDVSARLRYTPEEVIFLIDTSASMLVKDGFPGETRLESAKKLTEDILEELKGQTVSLYAFTSQLTPVVPPTSDYLFMRLATEELRINEGGVGGTHFADVLKELNSRVLSSRPSVRKTLILLTDGGDTRLEKLTGEERKKEKKQILEAIPDPRGLHLHVFAVGLGKKEPLPIPEVLFEGKPVLSASEPEILKEFVENDRGNYYAAEEWTSGALAQEIIDRMNRENIDEGATDASKERIVIPVTGEDVLFDRYFQIPLAFALLFYAFNLLLPDVKR